MIAPAAATGGHVAALLNAGSGDGRAETVRDLLQERFAALGRPITVALLEKGADLHDTLRAAITDQTTLLIAGGGDGTVSGVAAVAVEYDLPLGVLALGTLNHFAKDLNIPLEVEPAIETMLAGHTLRVDVGEVNGQLFLNNSSLGLYPQLVQLRQQYGARGMAKWAVAAWATARVMRTCERLAVRVDVEGQSVLRRTPLVFIGNNAYNMAGLDAGSRAKLTDGQLAMYIVRERTGLRLLQLLVRIVAGTAHRSGQLDFVQVSEATIETTASALPVAVDGEVNEMQTPLRYAVRPAALTVFVPAPAPDVAATPGAGSAAAR